MVVPAVTDASSMEPGKESPWSGTVVGIAALVALPFALLAWLLVQTAFGHIDRYTQMARVLDAFRAGLAVVEPLESMRDLSPSSVYLDVPEVSARYGEAHQEADARLHTFLDAVRAFDNPALRGSANRVDAAWQSLATADGTSNPVVPFENIERVNDEVYGTMTGLFFISDMAAGERVNANELLILVLETTRKARHELGLVRSIAVYTALREGHLGSTDAEHLDNAWTNLEALTRALDSQLGAIDARRGDVAPLADLGPVHKYLTDTESALVLAPQITALDWQRAWDDGEDAFAAMRRSSATLVDSAARLVAEERRAQLQIDTAAAIGLALLYAAITALGVMFYRTRYAELRARAENRAKSLFLARMSHEIRTPLNGVIGLAELLADTQPTPRQREYIELIGSAGRSLVSLVNDILDHARIEAGKLEINPAPIDTRALINESAQVFGLRAGQNRTLVFCVIDDAVPETMIGDPVRIRQVLLNLIANAVKFTEQGRVEVRAELAVDNEGEGRLRIEVRDTGIGLTPGEQQNLFNLFTQASPEVARRFGGTGLGLSISRELVRMMGGSIGVYTGVGAGSVFWFEIPLLPAGAEPAGQNPGADALALPALPAPVLMVDGDGHLARAIAALPAHVAERVSIAAGELDAQRMLDMHPEVRFVVINGQRRTDDALAIAAHLASHHPGISVRLLIAVGTDTGKLDMRRAAITDVVSRSVFTHEQLVALLTPARAGDATETHRAAPQPAMQLPGGLRVLVAEDNPVNQLVTRGLLRRLGIEADVVEDGRRAVDRYSEQGGNYDIVLMDLDMPVLDGNGAAREIRRREAASVWPRCPIIALSAHALPEYGILARQAGMDGQVIKPVTLTALSDALLQHAVRERPADGAARNDYTI